MLKVFIWAYKDIIQRKNTEFLWQCYPTWSQYLRGLTVHTGYYQNKIRHHSVVAQLKWNKQIELLFLFDSLGPISRERSGSVVECLTQDWGVVGSSLTGVTALWSLSKTHLS